jgi:hypothetical protein
MASGGGVLIKTIHLLRNVGQFDSVNAAQFDLLNLVVIYAEDGRGKTTLAAILRSARRAIPYIYSSAIGLAHRTRPTSCCAIRRAYLVSGTAHGPGRCHKSPSSTISSYPKNVCSGMELQPGHRQNLPCGSSLEQRRLGTRGAKTIAAQPSSNE